MTKRHLEGKGKFIYDYKYDILTLKTLNREYKKSVEFQNFVIDIDTENFVVGIRIFDASKVLDMKKDNLRHIVGGQFKASVENNVITVAIKIVVKVRNKFIPVLENKERFSQQFTTPLGATQLADSSVTCAIQV